MTHPSRYRANHPAPGDISLDGKLWASIHPGRENFRVEAERLATAMERLEPRLVFDAEAAPREAGRS